MQLDPNEKGHPASSLGSSSMPCSTQMFLVAGGISQKSRAPPDTSGKTPALLGWTGSGLGSAQ